MLIWVAALGGPDRGRHTLDTWDVETGALHRVSILPAGTTYDVVGMVLGAERGLASRVVQW